MSANFVLALIALICFALSAFVPHRFLVPAGGVLLSLAVLL